MSEFIRCKTCVMPNTRPDTPFIDGECSACVSYRKRKTIDWKAREQDLLRILETTPRNGSGYDCIVPSSGGKDSHWQALQLIQLGVRPLIVTARTCHLTAIGRRNIDNLARYATTIEVAPNAVVRAKLNRLGLRLVGDISWPEHAAIFSTPFKVACDTGIPLLFYGENPQEAYGGPIGTDEAQEMTRRWVSEFGGFLGLRPMDMVGQDGITERDMLDYMPPSAERVAQAGVRAYFLGQFYEWDSRRNIEVAEEYGMQAMVPTKANWWRGENIDNAQTGAHDWFMYRKFGFGRGCQQISVDVRSGRIDRDGALAWVREFDGLCPREYAGILMADMAERIGLTVSQIQDLADKFTNRELFGVSMRVRETA